MTELRGTFCHRSAPAERLLSYRHALRVSAFIRFIVPCVPKSVHTHTNPKTHRCRPPISAALRVTGEDASHTDPCIYTDNTHTGSVHSLWNRCGLTFLSIALWGECVPCTRAQRHRDTQRHTETSKPDLPRLTHSASHPAHTRATYLFPS